MTQFQKADFTKEATGTGTGTFFTFKGPTNPVLVHPAQPPNNGGGSAILLKHSLRLKMQAVYHEFDTSIK